MIPPHDASRHTHEQFQHGRVIRRTQSSSIKLDQCLKHAQCKQQSKGNLHWVPTSRDRKPIRAAPRVASRSDVVQHLRVSIQHGVDKANSALSGSQSRLVDPSEDRSESRRRG